MYIYLYIHSNETGTEGEVVTAVPPQVRNDRRHAQPPVARKALLYIYTHNIYISIYLSIYIYEKIYVNMYG